MKLTDILTEKSQAERKAIVQHDQYFTRPEVAKEFAQRVKSQPFFNKVTRIIEPSAGSGEIAKHFSNVEAYDIEPQGPNIQQANFLTLPIKYQPGTLTAMNAPFGHRSQLAIAFFNKAAQVSDYIAAIVPKTFRRPFVQDRLDNNFHLVDEYYLPQGSFYLPAEKSGEPYDVPTVAQIWVRKDQLRQTEAPTKQIEFTTKDKANIAFLRKGRTAGRIITGPAIAQTNPNSFFYIRGDERTLQKLQNVDWSTYGRDVIGSRSISQQDINKAVR